MARTKGAKNRVSSAVKDNIIRVFENIGGHKAMATWANKNPDAFYRMYGQMAPKEVIADVAADVTVELISYLDQDTDTPD